MPGAVHDRRPPRGRAVIVASFPREAALADALAQLRDARLGPVETYTPSPLAGEDTHSPIPLIILAAGLIGGAASFALQTYSSTLAYPFASGSRPDFAWASFIPTAFENAVLVAIAAGFAAFMFINRLPRLYDPVDEAPALRPATGNAWVLALRSEDPATLARARTLLRTLGPAQLDELPP